ncbi:MAG: GNAT family N-acetyltransferase [Planctomycetes bacterium]|nr:GNAT family N-acetyltransferase [Planctomycetota bacterium]
MDLELSFTNDSQVLSSVHAFIHETFRQLPLPTTDAGEIEDVVVGAVQDAVENAYPQGEEGSIKLKIREKHGRLEIRIRDFGIPQDVALLERRLHDSTLGEPGASATGETATGEPATRVLFGHKLAKLVDEVHWCAYGPQGKALQIVKELSSKHIIEHVAADALAMFQETVQAAPDQTYVIRRMRPDDAVGISQLMYRNYGNTYFNPDVYYPERIAAQNAYGSLLSIVAQGEDGYIAGHLALEMNEEGPVAEVGQAVVDPAHRGRGLLNRMKEKLADEVRHLNLAGWYAAAVCVHTLTQKSNVTHGGRVSSVNLGISPKTEEFRAIAEKLTQRVSCLLYFHWLKEPSERTVFVPDKHQTMIAHIYENLRCPIRFGEGRPPSGHGTLVTKIDAGAARGTIRAGQIGEDTVRSIRHAKRSLVEQSRAEVVFVELPLSNPATPQVVLDLENDGLGFAGIAPNFSANGDLLQLVYLVEPLAREPIKILEEFAGKLVDYALDQQTQIRDR